MGWGQAGAERSRLCSGGPGPGEKTGWGRGLGERKRGFPGGGGVEAAERGRREGNQPDSPLPRSSLEAGRVGQLKRGGGSAGLIWKPEGRGGHGRRQWGCVSVGERVYTDGRREEGREEEEGACTEARAGAYVRAGPVQAAGNTAKQRGLRRSQG